MSNCQIHKKNTTKYLIFTDFLFSLIRSFVFDYEKYQIRRLA